MRLAVGDKRPDGADLGPDWISRTCDRRRAERKIDRPLSARCRAASGRISAALDDRALFKTADVAKQLAREELPEFYSPFVCVSVGWAPYAAVSSDPFALRLFFPSERRNEEVLRSSKGKHFSTIGFGLAHGSAVVSNRIGFLFSR